MRVVYPYRGVTSMRVQFILKKNELYNFVCYTRRSSGLWNSTNFIVDALRKRGIDCDIVEVQDNNDIDREVTRFKPSICVIEALWVVPEKFEVLKALHPQVQWLVHLHSNICFLALEGIGMAWIKGYVNQGVGLIANSLESYQALLPIVPSDMIVHLPNIYLGKCKDFNDRRSDGVINIGCFGAIRPMKNQLIQALAAIEFAKRRGRFLKFHVNGSRIEVGGDPVLKGLKDLFSGALMAELILVKWNEPEEFHDYLNLHIDIGMQVSMTETFNVVTADYLTAGVPIAVSKAVKWVSRFSQAHEESVPSIVRTMNFAWKNRWLLEWNQKLLRDFSKHSTNLWHDFIAGGGLHE